MKLKFLLIGTSLSLIPQYATAQCAVTDCQQLGYTSLKSCDGGLKCPFGEYWACPEVEEKAVLGECTGYAKNCAMTASVIATNLKWSTKEVATGIGTTPDWTTAITDFEACVNTQKIIQQGNSSEYPAAWAAVNYSPIAAPVTKGKWCLPAPGMLNSL